MKRKLLYLFGAFCAIAFLTSFASAYATLTVDETSKIPRFLLAWSESRANGNLTELNRIRAEIVSQLKWNEEKIKSTDGAVLQPPPASPMTTFTYLTVAEWSPDTNNQNYPPPFNRAAWVENPTALGGYSQDGICTRLVAINWGTQMWGEALTHCHPSTPLVYGGGIYAWAKQGPMTGQNWYPGPGEWCNYLIAEVALNPVTLNDWHFVGYARVFGGSITMYYLGDSYNYAPYNHVSISTSCPYNWWPVERSDVLVDFAKIIGYP